MCINHFVWYSLQVNKEKCQAVVEFLTPEDATAALSFDGKSLFGSVLKIRRPKDFVEVAVRFLDMLFPLLSVLCMLPLLFLALKYLI